MVDPGGLRHAGPRAGQPDGRSGAARRYTIRLKFPKGYRVAPHTHPDSREVTVLSGTFANGYGNTFDASKLKAGSYYTEPSDVPHFIEVEEDVVLQVSGTGPSGRHFIHGMQVHGHGGDAAK